MCRVSLGGLGNITSARGVGEGESSEDLKIIIIQNLVRLMSRTRKFHVPHEVHGILPQNLESLMRDSKKIPNKSDRGVI